MSHQRSDRQVIADAARYNATHRDLRSLLYRNGIRNPSTSKKAQTAIFRAATERQGVRG